MQERIEMRDFQLAPDAHHYLGVEMNQQVWRLLAQPERDDQDKKRLEHFALASMFHWQHSPKFQPVNAQRAHWLLSRVYAGLRGSRARRTSLDTGGAMSRTDSRTQLAGF